MLKRERRAHRLIGNFGFSYVGRSFDAVQYVRDNKASTFTLVGGDNPTARFLYAELTKRF